MTFTQTEHEHRFTDGLCKCGAGRPVAAKAADQSSDDALFKCYLAFAKLEIIELGYGRRTLTECPGIEDVYRRIAAAKAAGSTSGALALLRRMAAAPAQKRSYFTGAEAAELLAMIEGKQT